jgi:mono/diheme cytochrome c family protein
MCLALFAAAGCAQEEYPAALWAKQHPEPAAEGSEPDAAQPQGPIVCRQARAQSLPARLEAMTTSGVSSSANVIDASDIYNSLVAACSQCHQNSVGGFQIPALSQFAQTVTPAVVQHITQAVCPTAVPAGSATDPMPPCTSTNGGTYSARPATDPIKSLGVLLTEWIAAGQPQSFTVGGSASADAGSAGVAEAGTAVSPYSLTPALGNAMTNIGTCVPASVATAEDPMSATLDKMFAGLVANPSAKVGSQQIGLPELLSQTDLFTLDSSVLAKYGVIAYAPGYPLWSDNAGKLRYVRVPHGTSIHFNKATQQFEIPPNTRFYKTFMKQIIDTDGSYRYRKIETRLIVSRPDVNNSDGTAKAQTALFGSYRWCAAGTEVACPAGQPDESEAYLVQTPLKSGTPFADTLFLYPIDENLATDIQKGQPADLEYQLLTNNAARNYAIPSSQRCTQCHMGSPSEAFILGFTPLQIQRRPTGSGGVIPETGVGGTTVDTGPDELTQLQRFMDYGLITGIDSVTDVLPLEQSQGSRTPRNNYELVAQGYMLGNCQHCHNPRGFPSVQDSRLKPVLDFLPGATGGIFQFPLETYSPVIGRGPTGTTKIPYITPSLVDLPRVDTTPGDEYGAFGQPAADIFVGGGSSTSAPNYVVYAPWRSLIYRNVDAAFAYTDDLAFFPHMPFNTPGYDLRAKQILGDWMVSIPAVRKHPEIVEYAYQVDTESADNIGSPLVDESPQPYAELPPGAPGYEGALTAASARLEAFHTGVNPAVPIAPSDQGGVIYSRYTDPGDTNDIVDPQTVADPVCHPIPTALGGAPYPFPNHPDWVITDTSEASGPWAPRQTDWPSVLVEQQIPAENLTCGQAPVTEAQAYADQIAAIGLLPTVTLDDIREYSTTPLPFGLWLEQTTGCSYSLQKQISSFTGAARPHWMGYSNSGANPPIVAPAPDAPVYMESPGAAVFKMICINCHGPLADSNGPLAVNLATLTGGSAQPADFRDGLFGPVSAPETNLDNVYGTSPTGPLESVYKDPAFPPSLLPVAEANWNGTTAAPVAADDRAARYMPWMALGGTTVNIPEPILQIVAATSVLGVSRYISASQLSANMLSQAKSLCLGLLGPTQINNFQPLASTGYLDSTPLVNRLILQNGDAELWLRLCAVGNPPPVHVLTLTPNELELGVAAVYNSNGDLNIDGSYLVDSSLYPAGTPVGNELGGVDPSLESPTASSKGNLWPWCVQDANASAAQAAWIAANNLPVCPCNVKVMSATCHGSVIPTCEPATPTGACFADDAGNAWAVRGAINAGMSVFLYVQSIEESGPAPDYNTCPSSLVK